MDWEYIWNLTQNFIPSIIPIIFYYVPSIIIKKLYNDSVKDVYKSMGILSHTHKQNISDLNGKLSRVITYVSFLSIFASTIGVFIFNSNFRSSILESCSCLALTVLFISLCVYNIVLNRRYKVLIEGIHLKIEVASIYLSGILLVLFGGSVQLTTLSYSILISVYSAIFFGVYYFANRQKA